MKKKILTLVAIFAAFTLTASATEKNATKKVAIVKNKKEVTFKNIDVKQPFHKLIVSGKLNVVLFEGNGSNNISMMGSRANMEGVVVTQENGVMSVSGYVPTNETLVVYIPVSNINEIEASENAIVSSATILESTSLTLVVNGECKFDVQSTARINIVEGTQCESLLEKFVTRKLLPERI